jgi:hypothetical protein
MVNQFFEDTIKSRIQKIKGNYKKVVIRWTHHQSGITQSSEP